MFQHLSMQSVKEMEAEAHPANKGIRNKSIEQIDKAVKPNIQVLGDGLGLDYVHMDKRASLLQKMKHLFSPSSSKKTKTAVIAEAHPANICDEMIERHREFLEEHVDPDFGLLDKLLAHGILSRKETSEVKANSPVYKRNAQLLDYILKKHKGDRLFEALRETEQLHIINYLNGDGGECGLIGLSEFGS